MRQTTGQGRGYLAKARVCIVGLGLMGASLAWALRRRRACRQVVGVARRQATASFAWEKGMVDEATCQLAEGLRGADAVILATPVRTVISLLGQIGPLVPEGCIVMDLGSTKQAIVTAMERLPPHVYPLGGHPMCGKEKSGARFADPDLYMNRVFVLTPLDRTGDHALSLALALVQAVGARPLVMDAQRHDRLVAAASHLPYLLACGLVATGETFAQDDSLWTLAAGGFRDTSRLAASDVTMMLDILVTNRTFILEALAAFENHLQELGRLLATEDEAHLCRWLQTIAERRRWLDCSHKEGVISGS